MKGRALQYAYEILDRKPKDRLGKAIQYFLIALISLNVLFVVIETEEEVLDDYGYLFTPFEIFSIIVFSGEYAARILVCKQNPKYRDAKFGRLRFVLTPMMLLDLAVILPFFLTMILAVILPFFGKDGLVDIRFLRIIRLLRIFRLFKLGRYVESMQMFGNVFKAKASDLTTAFFILFIVLILASSMMYYAEKDAQPEAFSSIPTSMWWGVITLTTIGYGDVVPETTEGKIIGGGIAVIGIAVYAIPTGIMVAAFTEEMRKQRKARESSEADGGKKCPHCGKNIG